MPAKYMQIASALEEAIKNGTYQQEKKLPTEKLIASYYKVSRQTVRQALSVLVQKGIIERKQGSGSWIKQTQIPLVKTHSIAIVTTYINDYIFPDVLRDAQEILSKHDYATLVYATKNQIGRERSILQNLLHMHIDGLLIEGVKTALPSPNLDLYRQFQAEGIPVVFLHSAYPQLEHAISVTDDNYGGGYLLARHLLNLGHTQIAGIFKTDDIQGIDRYYGYLCALRDASITIPDQLILCYNTTMRDALFHGRTQFLREFIQSALTNATGVICYNDEIAVELIKFLADTSIRVPQDLSIVSFDNSNLAALSPIPLTSLGHGNLRMGKQAAKCLLEMINGKDGHCEIIPWTLYPRESC